MKIEVVLDDKDDILSNPFLKEIVLNIDKKPIKKFDIFGCLVKNAHINTAGTYTFELVEDYIKFR